MASVLPYRRPKTARSGIGGSQAHGKGRASSPRAAFAPGSGTGRHQGIETEVGIVVEGEVTLESPLGRTTLRPGTAYFLPGLMPHDTRNESSRPARMFDILLKRCD